MDLNILINERLANPIESLSNVIKLFTHYQKMFSSQLPSTADIGLIQLDSKSARTKIQPTPEMYIKELNKFIPVEMKRRSDECKVWLQQRIRELSQPVADVEEFVQQTAYYNYTSDHFQNIRDKVDMFGQVYNVMADYQFKVKKEDKDNFNETLTAISSLSQIIQNVESS